MANTDQKLVITELDFSDIKNNLKNFLRDQPEFTDFDFEAAGINVLLDILAYNTHYMSYYNNMIANEMFLDTAVLRDSVVSHAKLLGYTPVSSTAARAKIDLQITRPINNTQTSLTLPKFTKFQSSPIDSVSYAFVNTEATVGNYDPSCGRFCFDNLYIKQGQPLSYTFTFNATNNPAQTFELPDTGIDTSTLEVIVQESATSLKSEKFTLSTDATTVTTTSPVFYLDESRNGKYKIYFGDNIIGKALTNGNLVTATYLKTNGAAANKANAFTLVESVGGLSTHIIYPLEAASGGSSQEGIDRVRTIAPKIFASGNRGVTTSDIIALINAKYPYFQSVNVWGGEENDPPVYGKVFVAAKPTLGYEITESEKLNVINNIIKPVCVATITPEFVDVDYNFLNVFATVYYDKTKTTRSEDAIKTLVRNAIIQYGSTELNDFNSRFKISKLLRNIDDCEISIGYSDAQTTIKKQVVPQLNTPRNYTFNYGVELSREDPKYRIFSSPGYTQYDSEQILRTCFIEETPGSSSGVEKISVLAATKTYQSTPSIVISGDGVGANAYPVIVNGKVKSIVVDKPGINYTSASAYLYYDDELDTSVKLSVSVQGRYGILRSYYFDENNIKTIFNPKVGTVDYLMGKITLSQFNPVDVLDSSKTFSVTAKPTSNYFSSSRNRILTIDDTDLVSINIEVKAVE
jgi:hypothetical protein